MIAQKIKEIKINLILTSSNKKMESDKVFRFLKKFQLTF